MENQNHKQMRFDQPKFKTFYRNPKTQELEPSRLKEIYKEIFVMEEFLPKEIELNILNQLNSMTKWNVHCNYYPEEMELNWFNNKLSLDMDLSIMAQMVSNIMTPEFMIFSHANFIRMLPGESSPVMCSYHDESPKKHDYNLALYVGNWTGGDLVFPKLNFTYSPKPRELLILKSDENYEHYVTKVISGTRYVWIDYAIKHPGYVVM